MFNDWSEGQQKKVIVIIVLSPSFYYHRPAQLTLK